jgi:hypothetical protein
VVDGGGLKYIDARLSRDGYIFLPALAPIFAISGQILLDIGERRL